MASPEKRKRAMQFGRYDHATFLSFFSYAGASVVIPVALVSLARDLGFSLEEGGMTAGGFLHLARTVSMVASMLLCAFWAGRWGKRPTFGVSVFVMALGIFLCAFAPHYGILLLALFIAGSGEGVIEGLATPFVQDLHLREAGRYINFSHSFWSVGVLTTVLLVGFLLSIGVNWRLLVGCTAIPALSASLLLLWPAPPEKAYPEHPERFHRKEVAHKMKEVLNNGRFWLFYGAMFLAGGGEFCLTFWTASYIQLHFLDAAWAGGLGTACFAGGMVLGRSGWGFLLHQSHLKSLILGSALAGFAITVFFPFVGNLWLFFGLLFLAGIATAPYWPSIQSYAVDCLPRLDSTSLLILLSCAGVPGCGFFTWLMGFMANRFGLDRAFFLVPICYGLLGLLVAWAGHLAKGEGETRPHTAGQG